MSCCISSSRVQTTLTGPSTCCAIWTARVTPSISSRRPKPPSDQMIVDYDLVQRQPGGLRRRRLGPRDDLGAEPNFATVLTDMNRAVHRFHRRMREERNLVDRLDLGDGT